MAFYCYEKILINLWVTEKRLEQLNTPRLQGCMRRLKLQPLLLFLQKVVDLLQNSSEESWIRVSYIPDNFVTFSCATEKREKEAGNRWSNFELFCQDVLICCTKKPQQSHQTLIMKYKEEPKMWSKMGAENASRSTFWLQCHKQNFWLMQPFSRAPDEMFGKYVKDMPMHLNLPDCLLYFLKSVSLDLELCLQTFKSPQIWKSHFLLRNTHQSVAYYWLDGSSYWQWHKTSSSSVQRAWRANTAFIHLFLKANP